MATILLWYTFDQLGIVMVNNNNSLTVTLTKVPELEKQQGGNISIYHDLSIFHHVAVNDALSL